MKYHIGFSDEIWQGMSRYGNRMPESVKYLVYNICDEDGRHVAWATSKELAQQIVAALAAKGEPL